MYTLAYSDCYLQASRSFRLYVVSLAKRLSAEIAMTLCGKSSLTTSAHLFIRPKQDALSLRNQFGTDQSFDVTANGAKTRSATHPAQMPKAKASPKTARKTCDVNRSTRDGRSTWNPKFSAIAPMTLYGSVAKFPPG